MFVFRLVQRGSWLHAACVGIFHHRNHRSCLFHGYPCDAGKHPSATMSEKLIAQVLIQLPLRLTNLNWKPTKWQSSEVLRAEAHRIYPYPIE